MQKRIRYTIITLLAVIVLAAIAITTLIVTNAIHPPKTTGQPTAQRAAYPRTLPGYQVLDVRERGGKAISLYLIPQGFTKLTNPDPDNTGFQAAYYMLDLRDNRNTQIATARLSTDRTGYLVQHLLYTADWNKPNSQESLDDVNILNIYGDDTAVVTAFNTYKKTSQATAVDYWQNIDHGVGSYQSGDTPGQYKTQPQARKTLTQWHVNMIAELVLLEGINYLNKQDFTTKTTYENGIYVIIKDNGAYDNYTVTGYDPKDDYYFQYDQSTGKNSSGKISTMTGTA